MSTYKRFPIVLTRGLGVHVWDSDGRCYLDLVGGIAVCALGHAHPRVVAAIKEQVENLSHVSNLYHIAPQILLARLLVENSPLRQGILLQQRGGGQRGGDQARPEIRLGTHGGTIRADHDAGLLPRPDLATVTATGQGEVSRRLCAASGRIPVCSLQRPSGAGGGRDGEDLRRPGRADPGGERRRHSRSRVSPGDPADLR